MVKRFETGPTLVGELDKALQSSQAKEEESERLSLTDSLTGIPNLRALDKELSVMVKRLSSSGLGNNERRESGPNYVLFFLIDVDEFDFINNTYGHSKGDDALKVVAVCLEEEAGERKSRAFRWGGDEFAIVQEGKKALTDAEIEAISLRIEKKINSRLFLPVDGKKFNFTVSVGCAVLRIGEKKTINELKEEADTKMYLAKKAKKTR